MQRLLFILILICFLSINLEGKNKLIKKVKTSQLTFKLYELNESKNIKSFISVESKTNKKIVVELKDPTYPTSYSSMVSSLNLVFNIYQIKSGLFYIVLNFSFREGGDSSGKRLLILKYIKHKNQIISIFDSINYIDKSVLSDTILQKTIKFEGGMKLFVEQLFNFNENVTYTTMDPLDYGLIRVPYEIVLKNDAILKITNSEKVRIKEEIKAISIIKRKEMMLREQSLEETKAFDFYVNKLRKSILKFIKKSK